MLFLLRKVPGLALVSHCSEAHSKAEGRLSHPPPEYQNRRSDRFVHSWDKYCIPRRPKQLGRVNIPGNYSRYPSRFEEETEDFGCFDRRCFSRISRCIQVEIIRCVPFRIEICLNHTSDPQHGCRVRHFSPLPPRKTIQAASPAYLSIPYLPR